MIYWSCRRQIDMFEHRNHRKPTISIAPAYMKGQRAPCRGPSDNQPQVRAMTRNIAVLGIGTDDARISYKS
jgi:hypothetical protein